MIKVKHLQNQIGTQGPHPCLYCPQCGQTYSADAGDYFAASPDHVFRHCGKPMRLGIERTIFDEVQV